MIKSSRTVSTIAIGCSCILFEQDLSLTLREIPLFEFLEFFPFRCGINSAIFLQTKFEVAQVNVKIFLLIFHRHFSFILPKYHWVSETPDPIIVHFPDHVRSNMVFRYFNNIGVRVQNVQNLLFDIWSACLVFNLFDQFRIVGVDQAPDFFPIAIAAVQHFNRVSEFCDACIDQQQPV